MATRNRVKRQTTSKSSLIRWLLDSDPAIRWQVMRDLTDAPADDVAAERARVATEGRGARVLALQPRRSRGAAWRGTAGATPRCTLSLLRELGLDPPATRPAHGGPGP